MNPVTQLLAGAQAFIDLGVPYKWGGTPTGTTAASLATDCSGMIQYLFGQIGIGLPRTSQEQATVGVQVPYSQIQPGDLIFYNYDGPNSHVALYAGNGEQYAETTTGTVASLQPVDTANIGQVRNVMSNTSGNTGGASLPSTYNEADNIAYAYQFFTAAGYTAAQASGIIGNLLQESGLNPESVQSGGPGRGIAQWSQGGRWNPSLMTGNNAVDLQSQLNYVLQELNGSYSSANDALKATSTPNDAAQVFMDLYEMPGDTGSLGARQSFATQLYNTVNSTTVLTSASGLWGDVWNALQEGWGGGISGVIGTQIGNNASGIGGDLSGLATIGTDLASGAWWSRILIFAGGLILFGVGLVGFTSTTKTGSKAIETASLAAAA